MVDLPAKIRNIGCIATVYPIFVLSIWGIESIVPKQTHVLGSNAPAITFSLLGIDHFYSPKLFIICLVIASLCFIYYKYQK